MKASAAPAESPFATPAGQRPRRWPRRSSSTRRRSLRLPAGSGASGPARGKRFGFVDVLGKVDFLPFFAADRDGADVGAALGERVDRAQIPAAGALGGAAHLLDPRDGKGRGGAAGR